jgi:hypothetical protein
MVAWCTNLSALAVAIDSHQPRRLQLVAIESIDRSNQKNCLFKYLESSKLVTPFGIKKRSMSSKQSPVSSASFENDLVRLGWDDGSSSEFHPLWLRDNCRCSECGDPTVGYRNLRLSAHDAEGFSALFKNLQPFRRHFPEDVGLITEFPILSVDEFGNLCGLRINDRVAAPLSISPRQLEIYYRGLRYLLQQSEDETLALNLTLQPGDIAVFDNHRVLHGRTDLTVEGQRWLQWIQMERGDFHSSLRIIADRLGLPRDASPLLKGAYGSPPDWNDMQCTKTK